MKSSSVWKLVLLNEVLCLFLFNSHPQSGIRGLGFLLCSAEVNAFMLHEATSAYC